MNTAQLEPLSPEAFEGPDNTDDIISFLFPSIEERRAVLPPAIAQQWKDASKFWFFHNGFCDRESIRRFLKAQTMVTLDSIAASFDIEALDLVNEKRKREGTAITKEDRDVIIEAIISSITI